MEMAVWSVMIFRVFLTTTPNVHIKVVLITIWFIKEELLLGALCKHQPNTDEYCKNLFLKKVFPLIEIYKSIFPWLLSLHFSCYKF